jgi:hypothetical protein
MHVELTLAATHHYGDAGGPWGLLGPLGIILEGGIKLLASDLCAGTGHGPDSGCAETGRGSLHWVLR